MSRLKAAAGGALVAAILLGPTLHAYLKLGYQVGNRIVTLHWSNMPVRYFVTNRSVPGVSVTALQERVNNAFLTWGQVETASVSADFGGFVNAEPDVDDGATVIGFQRRDDLDRVLGATSFTVDDATGNLVEADILLNSSYQWSVAGSGEAGRYDVQSIATHEIGHLLGLSHSALGETSVNSGGRAVIAKGAVMFPIAFPSGNVRDRALNADDKAGLTDLYGTTEARRNLGSIGGRVTLNNAGVYGAHVVAFNPRTGTSTGGFTLTSDGRFVIAGLERGFYVIRAEPLDDADLDSFFEEATSVNVNFLPGYAPGIVSVPAGGAATAVDIRVTPK